MPRMEVTAEQLRAIDTLCRCCRVPALRLFGSAAVGRDRVEGEAIEPQLRPLYAAAA
jgi:hypothetical protein